MSRFESSNTVDTLRIDEKSLAALYTNLDKRGGGLPRDQSGHRTKPIEAVLGLVGSDSQIRAYRVAVRTIAKEWCTVLVGMYIHPKQRGTITIPTASGERQIFEMTVRDCAHVAGRYHEARLDVETKIEILEIIGAGPVTALDSDLAASSKRDTPSAPESCTADDLALLLEAVSNLKLGESGSAYRAIIKTIMQISSRHGYHEVSTQAESLLESEEGEESGPEKLAALDASIQSLRPGAVAP